MATTPGSLLVSGATGWHSGNGIITYSFLGTALPGYYPSIDLDDDNTPDAADVSGGQIPYGSNVSMTVGERLMATRAIQAWNEVANINLVAGTISSDAGGGTSTPIAGNGSIIGGLGGSAGYGEIEVPRNDDSYRLYDISDVFENGLNFFGNIYTSTYVNTNGSISFSSGISTFTPRSINGGSAPMIAPYWADIDTRVDGVSPESAPIYVDIDPDADVVTFTWADVGYYNRHADITNTFQLQIYDRGSGDFDIVFRYQDINWTTGDASGGSNGLGGTPAVAGYSAGNGSDFFELPQSGNQSAMLGLDAAVGNTNQPGLWVFQVRNGQLVGDITFGAYDFGDPDLFGFVSDFTGTPGVASPHGDLWINRGNSDQNAAALGNTGWQTYLHELGHALGLRHPNEDPNNLAGDSTNNNQYTVMSYIGHPGEADESGLDKDWPMTPMMYDIAAIQQLYGANLTTRTSNTTYFGPGSSIYALDASGNLAETGRTAILTIWDAGGIDTIDASNQSSAVRISLEPGTFSTIGSVENNIGIAMAVTVGGQIVNLIENATGGQGDDILIGNSGDNRLIGGAGADTIRAGAGLDIADYSGGPSAVWINLASGTGIGGDAQGDTLDDVEHVIATDFADTLEGAAGNERLEGGSGNDTLRGRAGADILDGGAGNDTATYYGATSGVQVDLATGAGYAGDARGDTLISIEAVNGSNFDDVIAGGSVGETLRGNGGDDTLRGRAGADVLDGGAGIDLATYYDSAAGVQVDLAAGTTAGGDAQGDTLISIEAVNGSNFSDSLTGTTGAQTLRGFGGDDILRGGAGADLLDGGIGNDLVSFYGATTGVQVDLATGTGIGGDAQGDQYVSIEIVNGSNVSDSLAGSAAAETLRGFGGDDILRGGAGADLLDGGTGNDLVSFYGATIGVQVDLATGTGIGGDAQGDRYISIEIVNGSNVSDILAGSAAAETLRGFGGDDLLVGRDGADRLDGGAGIDVASYAASTSGVTVNLDTGTAAGGHADGDVLISIEGLVGSDFSDDLTGSTSADLITGGTGADQLAGGDGDDRFIYRAITDSGTGYTGRDTIVDFAHGDLIDLSAIDAGTTDLAFRFLGAATFDGAAGALRVVNLGSISSLVQIDIDGNGASDMEITLTGFRGVVAADFVL